MNSLRPVDLVLMLLVAACDGPGAATPAPTVLPAGISTSTPYVPQDVPEDRAPPTPAGGPTAADPDVARIDQALDAVHARVAALPRTDAGAPISSSRSACLGDLESQIAAARRSAEDRRSSIRAAAGRGDNDLVQHDLASLRVLADRAAQLAAEANSCR